MRVWVVCETVSRRILGVYSASTVAEDIAGQEDGRDVETHLVDEPDEPVKYGPTFDPVAFTALGKIADRLGPPFDPVDYGFDPPEQS